MIALAAFGGVAIMMLGSRPRQQGRRAPAATGLPRREPSPGMLARGRAAGPLGTLPWAY